MGEFYAGSDRCVLLALDLANLNWAEVLRGISGEEQVYRADREFAVGWEKRRRGQGFYASFGQVVEPFENPVMVIRYLGGIRYAPDDLDGMNR